MINADRHRAKNRCRRRHRRHRHHRHNCRCRQHTHSLSTTMQLIYCERETGKKNQFRILIAKLSVIVCVCCATNSLFKVILFINVAQCSTLYTLRVSASIQSASGCGILHLFHFVCHWLPSNFAAVK